MSDERSLFPFQPHPCSTYSILLYVNTFLRNPESLGVLAFVTLRILYVLGAIPLFSLIEVQLIYSDVLITAIQQSNSVYVHSFLCILFHYGLSQNIEYSSLCCAVGPCLSVLYYKSLHLIIPGSHASPHPTPSPLVTSNLFSLSVILFLFHRQVHLCHI